MTTAADIEEFFQVAKSRYVEEDDPLAYMFLTRYAHYCIVSKSRPNTCSFSWHNVTYGGIKPLTPERIHFCRSRLQGVKITTADYSTCLEAPGDNVFLFIDPPYVDRDAAIYEYGFTRADYYALAERLRQTNHRFLLTVGFGDFEKRLFGTGEFNVLALSHVGSELSVTRGNLHRYLVVTNYPSRR